MSKELEYQYYVQYRTVLIYTKMANEIIRDISFIMLMLWVYCFWMPNSILEFFIYLVISISIFECIRTTNKVNKMIVDWDNNFK